jgi:RimJ/RimL family protein N-acetyltransferase
MTALKSVTFRPLDPDRDVQAVADLYTVHERVPNSPATLIDSWRRFSANGRFGRFVAVEGERVVGFGRSVNSDVDKPGVFFVLAIVDPKFRGNGVGSRLAEMLLDFGASHGAKKFHTEVREDEPEAQAFAAKRGFEIEHRFFESTLDPRSFSSNAYAELIQSLRNRGIEFSSAGEQGGGDAALRRLQAIIEIADRDAPGDFEPQWDFEQFKEIYLSAKWFDPFAHIVAIEDGEYVGLSAVGETTPGGYYTLNTGVREDWRGKGVATALKSLAIDYVKQRGGEVIRTHNHSDNAAMIAINTKLGFQAEPGWFYMSKEVKHL